MANVAINRLTITGSADKVNIIFNELMPTGEVDLSTVIPIPEDLEAYGCVDESEWCSEFWGTSENAYSSTTATTERDGAYIAKAVSFGTTWDPPLPAMRRLAAANPDVDITLLSVDEGNFWACRVAFTKRATVETSEQLDPWCDEVRAFKEEYLDL